MRSGLIMCIAVTLLSLGCSKSPDKSQKPAGAPTTLITVTQAQLLDFEETESTVGTVESTIDPKITAEVPGRVAKVLGRAGAAVRAGELLAEIDPDDLSLARQSAAAEAGRVEVLLANQRAIVARNRQLVEKGFISQNNLDDSVAQSRALEQQLAVARAQLSLAQGNLAKARVVAPFDAKIERPIIAEGDFVRVGDPMFELVSMRLLNVYLPFPESLASRLHVGQVVRIQSPAAGAESIVSVIAEIKAGVTTTNRAVNAIVRLKEQAGWRPGATVNATVVVANRSSAVMVPEQCVVLRPAGKVVFIVDGAVARQRVVSTGAKQNGKIEISNGLDAGETIALDGAGFLADQSAVTVRAAAPAK